MATAAAGHPAAKSHGAGFSGLFGGSRKRLEEENEELRRQVTRLMGMDSAAVAAQAAAMRAELSRLRDEYRAVTAQVVQVKAELVRTSAEAQLQEVGVYEYQHPLADAVAYKARLAELADRIKVMARSGGAVLAATGWTVNGSAVEGRRMVTEYSKLMLRRCRRGRVGRRQ